MLDVVISGGDVVDGTGARAYRADVGIRGERIACIGDLSQVVAARVIDAKGLTVSPGFIDTHTHSEGDLLVDPQHACGLRQGITTEFLGIDGMSYAPLSHDNYLAYRRWLKGLLGEPPEDLDMSSVEAFRANYHEKVSINTAYLVPNGTVRLEAAGFRDVPLTGDLMARYKDLVREGMEQGAVGFSTGSSYYPGRGRAPMSWSRFASWCTISVASTWPSLDGRTPSGPSAAVVLRRSWRSADGRA